MADRLYNTLQLPSLAPGATSAPVAHGLHAHGVALVPDLISCPGAAVASVDDTNITITNTGAGYFAPQVMVQHLHSITRALGITGQSDPTIQPFVLSGASPPAGLVGASGLRLSRTPGIVNAYVDGVNGIDTNDGLTALTALKTIPRIYDIFPWAYMDGARLAVNLAGVGGFGANATAQLTYEQPGIYLGGGFNAYRASLYFVGPEMVPLTLATGSTAPTLAATPTVIVGQTDGADAGANRTRFAFTTPGWTAHDMRAKMAFLRVTRAGTKVLWEIPIADNGTDRLWIDTPVPIGNVLATDTVEIVTPGVLLQGTAADYNQMLVSGGESISAFGDAFAFTRIALEGVTVTADVSFDRCSFGSYVGFDSGNAILAQTKGTYFNISRAARVSYIFTMPTAGAPLYPGPRHDIVSGGGGGIFVDGGYVATRFGISSYANSGVGVISTNGGFIDASGAPTSTIQGDSNTSIGMDARYHGVIRCRGGKATTITGSGGDMRIDSTLVVAYGTGAGQFESAVGYNGNVHRFGGSTALVPLGKFGHIYI